MRKQSDKQAHESNGLEDARISLGKSIARWTDKGDQHMTAIPGLSLYSWDEPSQPVSIMFEPRICLSVQGAKRVLNKEVFCISKMYVM
jgi:hypothetical protein